MSLATLASLANQQFELEVEIEEAEHALAKLKNRHRKLCENDIPELMESLDVEEFKTSTGLQVTVNPVIRASITFENKPAAHAWLRANGHEKLIKSEFLVKPNADNMADVENLLITNKVPHQDKSNVHNSTLRAWAREMMENGKEIPECISVYRQVVSKVKV